MIVYMHDFGALSYGMAQNKGKLARELDDGPPFPYKKRSDFLSHSASIV